MDSFINWSRRFRAVISRDTNIPTDITFQIVDGDEVIDLKAHKMILGMVSPVFLNMFYVIDTNDRMAEKIIIQQTSAPAFQIMLDAIYFVKSIKNSLMGKTVDEIFAVLDVVTRYQIPELVDEVNEHLASLPLSEPTVVEVVTDTLPYLKTFEETARNLILHCVKSIKSVDMMMKVLDLVSNCQIPGLVSEVLEALASLPLSRDNVMKVASIAVELQPRFEEKSQDLLFNCAKFLMPRLTNAKSVFRFTADNEDKMGVVCKLQALMIDIPDKCNNCREKHCLNGIKVTHGNLRKGLIVMNQDTKLRSKVVGSGFLFGNTVNRVDLETNGHVGTFYDNLSSYPKLIFRCAR